jgi:hypothetical protein
MGYSKANNTSMLFITKMSELRKALSELRNRAGNCK